MPVWLVPWRRCDSRAARLIPSQTTLSRTKLFQNKRRHAAWTEDERSKLVQTVRAYTSALGRIRWQAVAKAFPTKSLQQVKSYYHNVMKDAMETVGDTVLEMQARLEAFPQLRQASERQNQLREELDREW